MQRGYAGVFTKTTRTQDLRYVQNEMGKLEEQELLSVWEGWHRDDNKCGWLDSELCARARREEVQYIRRQGTWVNLATERGLVGVDDAGSVETCEGCK